MNPFVQRHQDSVIGVLSGFDRLRFRGTLRWLAHAAGLEAYLIRVGVRLTAFKDYVREVADRIRASVEGVARQAGRPVEYLARPSLSKEDHARRIAQRDHVGEGLIAVLHAVEPCQSFRIGKDVEKNRIELHPALRQCRHYYVYWLDAEWGLCHVRLQTWFPLSVHICLNGREWLARQMDREGLGYRQRDNCFVWVEDVWRAQALFDRQRRFDWSGWLERLLIRSHPQIAQIAGLTDRARYYWSADQSEWATDVLFRSPAALERLYPRLIAYGVQQFGSREVLRFLGRRVPAHGGMHACFEGEVTTDLRRRPSGLRIKHRAKANSIKMYDKQGSVLRVETTINDPHDFKVYRRKEGHARGPKGWRVLRKGVADMLRRQDVSNAANERYLESLASATDDTPLGDLAQTVCRPARWKGGRVRALNPLAPEDARLLEAVNRGEFALNGLRNRDLREALFGTSMDQAARKRQSGAVTRKLRLLRAHGLIRKVPCTHRYVLSDRGRILINAFLAARAANTKTLTAAA